MAINSGYPYPGFSNPYVQRKLPSVNSHPDSAMCAGRIFIFPILGVLLLVLGLVSTGVYLNVEGSTSSNQYTEIMPLYINCTAVILAGVCVSVLFWKRFKILVFLVVTVCVATGCVCGITAVLTCTHVLQPLITLYRCRYYLSQRLCQCLSPYRRDMLSIQYSDIESTKYDFENVSSCNDVEYTLPQLLYALVVIYSLVVLLCIGSAILSLLVLRAEKLKQRLLGDESYDEVYTLSGSSSQDLSDSEPEVTTEVATLPQGHTGATINSLPNGTKNSLPCVAKNSLVGTSVSRDGSSLSVSQSITSATASNKVDPRGLVPQTRSSGQNSQRSRTPGINDLGKENLANRYKINKTPDRDLAVAVRQRLSKTPDREIGASRRYSFSASRRLSKSCDSLDSSGNVSREFYGNFGTEPSTGKKAGKLKEHRRKGKRAATVHTLDTDQLLLILNLQMRYLQETREQQQTRNSIIGNRRAITPQPISQKQIIPQKVRSHTPQPRRANQRARDQVENVSWNPAAQGGVNITNSENSSRRTSESSGKNVDAVNGCSNFVYSVGSNVGCEGYLVAQEMHRTAPNIREGYNPYIHTQNSAADNVHFVTYSDSMLNNRPSKPKSRASVQDYFLPPQPIHRGTQNQLPPRPLSRQTNAGHQLPPQPVHRGSSAFHIVDRKSRSPSVSSDRIAMESTPKRKVRKDYADVAIRENFSLNAKPFLLKDSRETENGPSARNKQLNQNQEKVNLALKREKYVPVENLPPYSGPPSYKEHVSSCNTSITSSLSSNPDDVYSLPNRRVASELDNGIHRGNPAADGYGGNNYGNSEMILSENLHRQARCPQAPMVENVRNADFHCSSTCEEAIYSSPARSKVKQYIVPENYYTQISKVSRDVTYANQRGETDTRIGHEINMQQNISENVYGNTRSFQPEGFHYTYNPEVNGQIAPDAKYNEYEDVYDTPESVQNALPREHVPVAETAYSVHTQGRSGANVAPKSKHKLKSPKKQNKSPYPVSNVCVNTRVPNIVNNDISRMNKQMSNSVENAHAENVSKIPRIKLNDHEVESCDLSDDDVFLNDDSKLYKINSSINRRSGQKCNVVETGKIESQTQTGKIESQTQTGKIESQTFVVVQNQNYQEISDFESANNTPEESHMEGLSDLANEETETGYMKMSLPGKNVSQYTNQIAPITSNQIDCTGDLTVVANHDSRPVPDGIEHVSSEDTEDFVETGV